MPIYCLVPVAANRFNKAAELAFDYFLLHDLVINLDIVGNKDIICNGVVNANFAVFSFCIYKARFDAGWEFEVKNFIS